MAARWVGAVLYAAAAAAAATVALGLDGPLDPRQLRETVPLAGLLGGGLGLGVNERWPLRADSALATGLLTAFVGLVFFSGIYLFADAVIEAWRGGSATKAVADASQRLGERMPVAAPLTIGAFMLAALAMWALAASGRGLRRLRNPEGKSAGGGETAEQNSDPGAAGAA